MSNSLELQELPPSSVDSSAPTANSLRQLIAAHPFTQGLNPRYLHLLADCATLERFGPFQTIFAETGEADRFHLVLSGRIALQTFVPGEGTATLQTIEAGEALGWSWLFPPYRWHLSAVALEPTEVVRLEARKLRAEIEENHDFGYEMTSRIGRTLMERLRATHLRLHELYHVPS